MDGMTDEMVVLIPRDSASSAFGELDVRLGVVLSARPRVLVLDMAVVERVSSTTVSRLLSTRRQCAAHGVEVVLRRPSRRCRDVLARAGLLQLVRIEAADPAHGAGRPHSAESVR